MKTTNAALNPFK